MTTALLPGSTIGVLGSGQLGRMLALAAREMGYRVHTYSPESDSPTGQVADHEWVAPYNDTATLQQFVKKVDVVTFEFENIPSDSLKLIEQALPVFPSQHVLYTTQHRIREKTFLSTSGFPVTAFFHLQKKSDIPPAIKKTGLPAVYKTAGFGYDGKGQKMVNSQAELEKIFDDFNQQEAILEARVDFQAEMSVIAARNIHGDYQDYGVVENRHRNHILDLTLSPFMLPAGVLQQAKDISRGICEKLDLIGVLCIEMFLTQSGKILVNELAPRPHNSGHFTIDACVTSQFEQQVRAVCGLPLGSPEQFRPAAMINLLGDIWEQGQPNWHQALRDPRIKLHLYGKSTAKKGRKMGHLTAVAETLSEAEKMVIKAKAQLEIS